MRILVVGAIQGGTVPIGRAIFSALEQLGQKVNFIDFSDLLDDLKDLDNNENFEQTYQFSLKYKTRLLEKVVDFEPDVIFGVAQSPLNDVEILVELKKAGVVLGYWFFEDYQVFDYWKSIAPYFDYFFTIQKEPFWEQLRQMGCHNYHYLPAAFNPDLKCPVTQNEPKIPVSFVGAPYRNRVHFFNKLHRRDFNIYGDDWNKHFNPAVVVGDRRISEIETRDIYQRSLININLHSSTVANGLGKGDFVNPRTFELAGLGAFQLTDMRKLLTLHFDLAEEIIALNSWEDMETAIDYFLEHETERCAFAKKAQEKVLSEHTYVHRAAEILSVIS